MYRLFPFFFSISECDQVNQAPTVSPLANRRACFWGPIGAGSPAGVSGRPRIDREIR